MHLTIRADGDSQIGYGHLVRTSALAVAAHDAGASVTVATTTPEQAAEVFPDYTSIVTLDSRSDPGPFIDWLVKSGTDVVFTDAYPIDTSYQRAIRSRCPLAVLQDNAHHSICADVFVNGNLYASELSYAYEDREPTWCLGPAYVLLRPEIRQIATRNPAWRNPVERILVTMGGSDVSNVTPTVVRAAEGFDVRIDVVVGPGFTAEQEQEVRTAAADSSTDVRVVVDPDDLLERMFDADFAISTASSTTYELLALGTPLICQPVVSNQDLIAGSLRDRDLAIVLDRDADERTFRRAIGTYLNDGGLRWNRRQRGRRLLDGRGAKRTYEALLSAARNYRGT